MEKDAGQDDFVDYLQVSEWHRVDEDPPLSFHSSEERFNHHAAPGLTVVVSALPRK